MEKNIGKTDSYLRLSGGTILLGYGAIKRSPLIFSLGAWMLTEGITQKCPVYHMLGISTNKSQDSSQGISQGTSQYVSQ